MSTCLIALLRRFLGVFLLVLTLIGSAHAQAVMISGSGNLTTWVSFDGLLPTELETAFPIGSPFNVTMTYDAGLVHTVEPRMDATIYRGAVASLSAAVAGHFITQTPGILRHSNRVFVINSEPVDPPWGDVIETGDLPLIDNSDSIAGLFVTDATVTLFNKASTALSSTELPDAICFAAWEDLWFAVHFFDTANDALHRLVGTGTPDRSIDSDRDGVSDGVELLHACINACAGDTDADGDLVLDRNEIGHLGTDPCSQDTDGDGLIDGVDPNPLETVTPGGLAWMARDTAADVLAIPEAAFEGPNANAERGRRNALANRLHAAANALQAGNLQEALAILEHVLDLIDGDPAPPDVIEDGPAKDALRQEVETLFAVVRAALGV